jgi:hypothetical protein
MWGQAANQLQQNQGGGFNADQVNIQTKNVNVALYPTRNPYKLAVLLGTQSVYDTLYDPAITSALRHRAHRLQAHLLRHRRHRCVGVFGRYGGIWKASFLPLGAAQPDKATKDDARLSFVWFGTLDYAYPIQPGTVVGLSYWHLQDDTKARPTPTRAW